MRERLLLHFPALAAPVLAVCLGCAAVLPVAPASASTPAAEAKAPDAAADESARVAKLARAVHLVEQKHGEAAIRDLLDPLVAEYEALYGQTGKRYFSSRSQSETLAYLLMAAAAHDRGEDGRSAVALGPTWADAHYTRAYVLIELGRIDEAKTALRKAVELSPYNAQFLAELAFVLSKERDWQGMLDFSIRAADASAFSDTEDAKVQQRGRALRSQGYALVELGRLDEAEAVYRECLKLDPADDRARRELDYVLAQKKQTS